MLALAFFLGVSGQVLEAGTRLPLANAAIGATCGDAHTETTSDALGHFTIDLPSGDIRVHVAALDYAPVEQFISADRAHVKIYLRRASDRFSTVVRANQGAAPHATLSQSEIEKIPGTYGDPFRAVENLPGVARAPLFGGSLSVRGTGPEDSQVFLDGSPLPALFHFELGPAILPDYLLDNVSFTAGGFGARYGQAVGGIVDASTAIVETPRFSAKLTTDFLATSAEVNIPLGDHALLTVAGRRSYVDLVLGPIARTQKIELWIPTFWDFQARLQYATARFGTLDVLAFGAIDDATLANPDRALFGPPSLARTLLGLRPRWRWRIDSATQNTLTALATYHSDAVADFGAVGSVAGGPPRPGATTDSVWQIALRDELSWRVNANIQWLLGADFLIGNESFSSNLQPFASDLAEQFPLGFIPDILLRPAGTLQTATGSGALYSELELTLGRLHLSPGLRLESFSSSENEQSIQPRMHARYALSESLSVRAACGLYQKAPVIAYASLFDNPGLTSTLQSSAGVEWSALPALAIETTAYADYLWNDIQLTPDDILDHLQGRTFGLEVFARLRPFHNAFGWISYSLSRSERLIGNWVPFINDQTHVLTVVGGYLLPHGFQVGIRFRLATGRPVTPVRDTIYDTATTSFFPLYGPLFSQRLPLFHQLDVRIDKTFVFDTWKFGVYIDVQNVYNQQNAESFTFSADFSKRKYINGLPILPTFGLWAEI